MKQDSKEKTRKKKVTIKSDKAKKNKSDEVKKESVKKESVKKVVVEENEVSTKQKSVKPLFIKRLFAYLIDFVVVVFIANLITTPFINQKSLEKLNKSSSEIVSKYSEGEISSKTYITEAMNISYQSARLNGFVTLITILLEILYFVVFQFYNAGQTIGKKFMKIKVVSSNEEPLSMNQMVVRSLIIDSILLEMIIMFFVIFFSEKSYFYGALIFNSIQYVVLMVSFFMIGFSKSGNGLHDIIAHTSVVKN